MFLKIVFICTFAVVLTASQQDAGYFQKSASDRNNDVRFFFGNRFQNGNNGIQGIFNKIFNGFKRFKNKNTQQQQPMNPTTVVPGTGGNVPGEDNTGNIPGQDNGGNLPGGEDGGNLPGGEDGGAQPGGENGGAQPGGEDGGNVPDGGNGGNNAGNGDPPGPGVVPGGRR